MSYMRDNLPNITTGRGHRSEGVLAEDLMNILKAQELADQVHTPTQMRFHGVAS